MAGLRSFIRLPKRKDQRKMTVIIDSVSFKEIFVFWVVLIMLLGLVYHFASDDFSHLIYTKSGESVTDIFDSVYFSFVTATTTGFGDIVPFGHFKDLAVAEVLIALMLLALVTSKLVSMKQNVILGEIYEISLNEKMYNLRSSLLLFRQHLERLMNRIDDRSVRRREITNINIQLVHLEDTLRESISIAGRSKGRQFVKAIDDVNAELLLNSIVSSLEKIDEFIKHIEEKKYKWKSDCNVSSVKRVIGLSSQLVSMIDVEEKKPIKDVKNWFERVSSSIVSKLPEKGYETSARC